MKWLDGLLRAESCYNSKIFPTLSYHSLRAEAAVLAGVPGGPGGAHVPGGPGGAPVRPAPRVGRVSGAVGGAGGVAGPRGAAVMH